MSDALQPNASLIVYAAPWAARGLVAMEQRQNHTGACAMLMIIVAIVMICAVVSTAETRRAGAEAVKPYARIAGIATVALWAIILVPELFR